MKKIVDGKEITLSTADVDKRNADIEKNKTLAKNSSRIVELKMLLSTSDYKVLPDYDQDSTQIKLDRQAWREEIRLLEDA